MREHSNVVAKPGETLQCHNDHTLAHVRTYITMDGLLPQLRDFEWVTAEPVPGTLYMDFRCPECGTSPFQVDKWTFRMRVNGEWRP